MELTEGNGNERQSLKEHLKAACLYLIDRGYADYQLYADILDIRSSFVARLRCNAVMEVIKSRLVTPADRAAGVESDQEVWLGDTKAGTRLSRAVRVIKVHVKNAPSRNLKPKRAKVNGKVKIIRTHDEEFDAWLVTDRMDLTAEALALLYRYRWHVETFFVGLSVCSAVAICLPNRHKASPCKSTPPSSLGC
jgi:IS4 transposase